MHNNSILRAKFKEKFHVTMQRCIFFNFEKLECLNLFGCVPYVTKRNGKHRVIIGLRNLDSFY